MADPSYRVDPGVMVGKSREITVTFSCHTGANADNDVIAATQEVANFMRVPGGSCFVHSIILLDEDDQAQDVDLIFLNADGSVGAEDAAFAPTDAVARTIRGNVLVAASEYCDANTSQFATKTNVGLGLKAAAATTSMWMAAVCRSGTPTYSAAGLKAVIVVMDD